jgi:ADP-ribosyl-[dinitrogen reductase] hydrolase
VPWEGRPPQEIDAASLESLPSREAWPRGSTSDDTDQLLLAARAYDEPRAFMELLATELPRIRGAGPSTTAAVEEFRRSGRLEAIAGDTNGAAMRAPAIGWAIPPGPVLRAVALRNARTTHAGEGALHAAVAVAEMASRALEGEPLDLGAADWRPPPRGVSLDATETLEAVRHVIREHEDPADAMRAAVMLGGDTDTVAAIAGGILGCRAPEATIPWIDRVLLPDSALLDELSEQLAARRAGG